jgi:hypothetical protein
VRLARNSQVIKCGYPLVNDALVAPESKQRMDGSHPNRFNFLLTIAEMQEAGENVPKRYANGCCWSTIACSESATSYEM